jgi:hypothetical protein
VSWTRSLGGEDQVAESWRSSLDNHKPWRSWEKDLIIRQVEDHVWPGLTRRVPTIYVLLSTLFQECISNFAVYMLLLQKVTITEQNMRVISIFESSCLGKPEELNESEFVYLNLSSLLWNDKVRVKQKTYKWVSVWWNY